MREREAALQQVEAMKRDLSMGNAQQRVPHILNTVPDERRADEAKWILQKLGRKVLKGKPDQGWVQQLFAAAGEDP